MKVIIPLILLVVQFILSICFQNLEGTLFGYHIRTVALVAGAIGQLLSLYLISMFVLYLVGKIQTRDGKRLIVGCFILLFAFLWRFNLVDKAQMKASQYDKTASATQQNKEKQMTPYDRVVKQRKMSKEVEKLAFEKVFNETATSSAQLIEKLNLKEIPASVLTSKTQLANVLKARKKTLNEISRGAFYNELVKEQEKAMMRGCNKIKEEYNEVDCDELLAEGREQRHREYKELADMVYDMRETEFAYAQFILDHYENFKFDASGEMEDAVFDTEAQRSEFVKLTEDVGRTYGKFQDKITNFTDSAKRKGYL